MEMPISQSVVIARKARVVGTLVRSWPDDCVIRRTRDAEPMKLMR